MDNERDLEPQLFGSYVISAVADFLVLDLIFAILFHFSYKDTKTRNSLTMFRN